MRRGKLPSEGWSTAGAGAGAGAGAEGLSLVRFMQVVVDRGS